MKWLIASDLHGSVTGCKKLLDAFRKEEADRLLLLGDILHTGVFGGKDKEETAEMLNAMADRITCVRGNCDSESDVAMLRFPVKGGYDIIPIPEVTGRMIFATHGDQYDSAHRPDAMQKGDILLQGHTHVPMTEKHNDFLCFNPGSVGKPLWGSTAGYMTLEHGVFRWKTMEGEEYRSYSLLD